MENKENDYRKELEESGIIGFVPGGNSMYPTLKNLSQSVIIKKVNGDLKKYDVALFQRKNGTYVLHRVTEVYDDGYEFTGDSQFYTEMVNKEDVLGIMVGFTRGEKFIDVKDPKYILEVKKLYSSERHRKNKVKWFFRKEHIKSAMKKVWNFGLKGEKK